MWMACVRSLALGAKQDQMGQGLFSSPLCVTLIGMSSSRLWCSTTFFRVISLIFMSIMSDHKHLGSKCCSVQCTELCKLIFLGSKKNPNHKRHSKYMCDECSRLDSVLYRPLLPAPLMVLAPTNTGQAAAGVSSAFRLSACKRAACSFLLHPHSHWM